MSLHRRSKTLHLHRRSTMHLRLLFPVLLQGPLEGNYSEDVIENISEKTMNDSSPPAYGKIDPDLFRNMFRAVITTASSHQKILHRISQPMAKSPAFSQSTYRPTITTTTLRRHQTLRLRQPTSKSPALSPNTCRLIKSYQNQHLMRSSEARARRARAREVARVSACLRKLRLAYLQVQSLLLLPLHDSTWSLARNEGGSLPKWLYSPYPGPIQMDVRWRKVWSYLQSLRGSYMSHVWLLSLIKPTTIRVLIRVRGTGRKDMSNNWKLRKR
jgi:hypothetical protein